MSGLADADVKSFDGQGRNSAIEIREEQPTDTDAVLNAELAGRLRGRAQYRAEFSTIE